MQSAICSMNDKRHRFDSLRGSDVKAWLLTIVKNCHLTALTQQQRRACVPLPEEDDVQDGHAMIATTLDPESTSIRRDEERTVDRLLSALPEEHREV
jgi:DNA-directed RNA polymerase specialized sigma24 family protein